MESSPPLNNYKGLMLCNRPNENVFVPKERYLYGQDLDHFAREFNPMSPQDCSLKNEMGLHRPLQCQDAENVVLQRHKRWLEEFKLHNQIKKHQQLEQQLLEEEKFQKVRDMAKKDRVVTKKIKEQHKQMNDLIMKEMNSNEKQGPKQLALTEQNLKKLEGTNEVQQEKQDKQQTKQTTEPQAQPKKSKNLKPKWALTKEQLEEQALEEEEDLLNFVSNLDYDSYVNDMEVNIMLKALKQRVNELREDKNWRQNAEKEIHDTKSDAGRDRSPPQQAEDIYDRISQNLNKNDEAKSVASSKTQNSINKLREEQKKAKEGKQEWDKATTAKPLSMTLEDRIAKNVADEILRTYKHLGNIHSNTSVRKILEREAHRQLHEGSVPGPVIQITKSIDKTKSNIDPNNLPYLHRNPAI